MGDERKPTTSYLDPEIKAWLIAEAARRHLSMSRLIEVLAAEERDRQTGQAPAQPPRPSDGGALDFD